MPPGFATLFDIVESKFKLAHFRLISHLHLFALSRDCVRLDTLDLCYRVTRQYQSSRTQMQQKHCHRGILGIFFFKCIFVLNTFGCAFCNADLLRVWVLQILSRGTVSSRVRHRVQTR